jgi:hypothetical protein
LLNGLSSRHIREREKTAAMKTAARAVVLLAGTMTILTGGCFMVPPEPAPPPTTMSSWGPFGGFTMSSGANCAGHATLTNGAATIRDSCFTSSENIVLCTDTSAAVAVSCSPGSGRLTIYGLGTDTIAYARVR